MKKSVFLLLTLLIISLISGCSEKQETTENCNEITCSATFEKSEDIEKIEIFHFHSTHQCYSCKTVGAYAEETVNTYFTDEIESGKIVFDHINGDLSENKDLVMKYGVTGSSLWLGTYNGEEFKAEENVNVWYKIRDKKDYMTYLKSIIEQKLAGN